MNKLKYFLTLAFCFVCTLGNAQTRVSGHVWSKADGPIVMAYVVEQDKNNRNITVAQTDANGNFSMTVKSTANNLRVSYIGYSTRILSIGSQTKFNIELVEKNALKEASVTVTRKVKTGGLVIPEREISTAQQTLNMDEMEGLSFETAGEALQGQIAGLDIVSKSGNLGAGTSMRLRGTTTINGNQEPLIVVDDYILEDYSPEGLDFDNMENEEQFANLLQVNPDDIASIRVLKDAAATARYGSNGANGVIEIRTRRGARGKTRVNFTYRFSGSWQPQGMKLLDGDGYTMMLKEAYHNPRKKSEEQTAIAEIMYLTSHPAHYANYNKNTDWVDAVTKFGQTHNYGIAIQGGGEKANFRLSGAYDHETGTIIKQSLDRLTTRLALDYWVSDRIKFSSNFALTYTKNNQNYGGPLAEAYQAMPNMSIYRYEFDNVNQTYFNTGEYFIMPPTANSEGLVDPNSGRTSNQLGDMVSNGNPVAKANLSWRRTSNYTITPQFDIEYKFLGKSDDETQLNYKGSVYLNAFTYTQDAYMPGSLTSNSWNQGINVTGTSDSKSLNFTTRHELAFRPKFYNDKHVFQAAARLEARTTNSTSQSLSSSGVVGGITEPTVAAYLTGASSGTSTSHDMNGLLEAHYSYGSKYSAYFSLRADGSTKFGSGNKWGFFPGISGRWNVSDENFWEPLRKVVNMFALRGGWGLNGISPSSEGLMYNNYGKRDTQYNGTSVMYPQNLRLTLIRWEKAKSWNVGANVGLWNDLISIDFNCYNKKTTDLLNGNVRISSTTGFTTLAYSNVGSLENEGWELNMNTRWLKVAGKFQVKLRGNIAQNRNLITSMDASVLAAANGNGEISLANSTVWKRVQVGNALGGIYGFRFKGVYAYDYDHNGYFLAKEKNNYWNPDGTQNTAAATGKTSPIVRDAEGNVVYDKNGNPLQMSFNYGESNYMFEGGDVIYEDINHDGTINELDIVYLGSSNPKINGGFGIDFRYGQWELRTNFNFRIGNKIINMARLNAESMTTNRNQSAAVNHRWRKNGQETEIPRAMSSKVTPTYNSLVSDRYVENGDYLRWQYFQFSYNFKTEKIKKIGLSQLRLAFSGNNLIFWSKYTGTDPEHSAGGYSPAVDGNSTPRSKSFTFSLNVGF